MDFTFTDEQQLLVETVKRCLADEATFAARQVARRSDAGWSPALWSTLCGLGVPAAVMRELDGGLGGGAVELALLCREAGGALLLEPVGSSLIANAAFARYANASARARDAQSLCTGERLLVPAFRTAQTSIHATRTAHGYQLLGCSAVIYHAPLADDLLLAVSTTGSAQADALVCVNRQAAGLVMTPCITVDGQRAADIDLQNVQVPADDVWVTGCPEAIEWILDVAMLSLAADTLGSCERTLALTIDYLKTRQQFGGPIGRFQALQHRVVGCLAKLEELRTSLWLTAARLEETDRVRRLAVAALQVVAGETARHIGEEAVQLHGGMGVTEEMEVSHHFRRLVAATIRHGSVDEHLQRYAQLRFASA